MIYGFRAGPSGLDFCGWKGGEAGGAQKKPVGGTPLIVSPRHLPYTLLHLSQTETHVPDNTGVKDIRSELIITAVNISLHIIRL